MSEIYVDIFDVESKKISINEALEFVTQGANGAQCLFVGTVRDFNFGRKVKAVSYDVFEPLAKKSFMEIANESQQKWGQELSIYLVHSKGRLEIGGVSIVIAVGSPHRDEAYRASRYIIEQVKHRSSIWKLEHYQDGDSQWSLGCELCSKEHHDKSHSHD